MAGGKMSARQKMINLMYLVFIAMLAMNMSKEVLSAFGYTNQKLEDNNVSTTNKNNAAYSNLQTKASEQGAKFGALNAKALKIKEYSNDFYNYVEELKTQMLAEIEDKTDYEAMDKTDWLDAYFFKGDGYTPEGQAFLDQINGYKERLIKLGIKNEFVTTLQSRFNTDDVKRGEKKTEKFLNARYEGFPMIASLTNFTQIQTDIRNTESDIVSDLLGGQLESDSKLTGSNYKGIVSLNKTAYFAGEKVKGQVVLGRYDSNLVPTKVTLNGNDITNSVQNGQVMLDLLAGNVGEKTLNGVIYFIQDGKEEPIPFESKYSVIAEPSSAVVSADKMNVVYRGIDNPISVSLPGVADKDLKVSTSGGVLTKKGTSYVLKPGAAATTKITVNAKLSSGKNVLSNSEFRVKEIPAAQGVIRGEFGKISLPGASIPNITIGAGLPDFLFDLKLVVTSFKVGVPGQFAVDVQGSQMSSAAKNLVSKARKGDLISIYDIKAKIIDNNYKLKRVLPIIIEVSN